MYKKIVVPLDGSKLAECVLPYVAELSQGCGAQEVILVSVTEKVVGRASLGSGAMPAPPTAGQWDVAADPFTGKGELAPRVSHEAAVALGKMERQAQSYLSRIAKRLAAKGVPAKTAVLLGNPAEAIISLAEEQNANLIAMASHGRSGPSRWAFGSVADKVFRASKVPVLLIRAPGCGEGI